MFFRKNKKIDSRVRFQNSRFKNRLQQARGYKRNVKILPQTDWGIFLSKIGLGSWLARSLTLLVLLFLVYLVYIPNFLFIKHLNITGLSEAAKPDVITSINSFLRKQLPSPQKNLVLLSKAGLEEYLLKNNRDILKVNKISKKFPDTLNLDLSPRLDEFILETSTYTYIISNDGLVTGQPDTRSSSTLPGTGGLIKLSSAANLGFGQQALTQEKVNFLSELAHSLPKIAKSPISYFQITDLQTPDLTVYAENGFRVLFDFNSDVNETLSQLKVLFTQFSDAGFKKLAYVDMRFAGKGYICNKDAPCVNDINLQNNRATTTPVLPIIIEQ